MRVLVWLHVFLIIVNVWFNKTVYSNKTRILKKILKWKQAVSFYAPPGVTTVAIPNPLIVCSGWK